MKPLEHLKHTLAICQTRHSSGQRPPCLASLDAVAKYGTATTPLPSLATGGGDEVDAGAGGGDEATDVRERDLVLVPIAETIRGYEQHHGLGGAWRAASWQRTLWSQRCGAAKAMDWIWSRTCVLLTASSLWSERFFILKTAWSIRYL